MKEATANKLLGMGLGGAASTQLDIVVYVQYVGAIAAVVGVFFSGAYYIALIVIKIREARETARANKVKEQQRKRELDIEERKLKDK